MKKHQKYFVHLKVNGLTVARVGGNNPTTTIEKPGYNFQSNIYVNTRNVLVY